MHKSASKGKLLKFPAQKHFAGLHGYNEPARKIEQVMVMILVRLMVPWHVQLPR